MPYTSEFHNTRGSGVGLADLDLHVLGASEDRVLTDGEGLDWLLVSLESQNRQHVLKIPHLQMVCTVSGLAKYCCWLGKELLAVFISFHMRTPDFP